MTENMLVLAGAIAVEMGDDWIAEDGYWSSGDAILAGPDGVRFHIRTGGYQIGDDKVRVSGSMPREWIDFTPSPHSDGAPRNPGDINMTLKKSPAAMAREITRRLLPGWTEYFVATRDRKAAHDARDEDIATFGDQLVATIGPAAAVWEWSRHENGRHGRDETPADHPGRDSFRIGRYGDPVRAAVKLSSDGGTVELDIRDRDALASLVEWIAARRDGA